MARWKSLALRRGARRAHASDGTSWRCCVRAEHVWRRPAKRPSGRTSPTDARLDRIERLRAIIPKTPCFSGTPRCPTGVRSTGCAFRCRAAIRTASHSMPRRSMIDETAFPDGDGVATVEYYDYAVTNGALYARRSVESPADSAEAHVDRNGRRTSTGRSTLRLSRCRRAFVSLRRRR